MMISKFITSIGALLFLCCLPLPSFGQGNDITYANGRYLPPGEVTQGLPPAPGSGANAPMVNRGDAASLPAPSGRPFANPVNGTNFPTDYMPPKSRVNLLVNDGRGNRVALTFQPDQLTNEQRSKIQGMLGGALFSTQPYQNINVSKTQIQAIQKALFPPPNSQGETHTYTGTPDGNVTSRAPRQAPQFISEDMPAEEVYSRHSAHEIKSPRLPIRQFSKYLVIGGIVIGCIQLVIAAGLLAFGHRNAGASVIAAAAGLMLLLMAFSIWKIDMVNVYTARIMQTNPSLPDSYDVGVLNMPGNPPLSAEQQVTGSHTYQGDNTLSEDIKTNSMSTAVAPTAKTPTNSGYVAPQNSGRPGLPLAPLAAAH